MRCKLLNINDYKKNRYSLFSTAFVQVKSHYFQRVF